MASDTDGDEVMADSSASSLNSPGSAEEAQQSRGLDTQAIASAQDHQQPSFRQSTSDALSREKEPKLEFTSIPSTPHSRRVAPSDYSPATPSVRRRLFSSPATPLEFPDENRPPGNLGLGITGSPSSGRAQTLVRKKIVAGKGAQARQSVSAIKENEKPGPTSDTEKMDGHKKKGKGNHKRVQRKNQMKRMKMKMKKGREEKIQPQVQSSHGLDSRNSTTTNQLHSHSEISGDECPSQATPTSPPLARLSSSEHLTARPDPNDSGTDSDSTSDSDTDVDAELFGHVKPEPPKPVAYRGYIPPYGGDYNHFDYWNASVRGYERLWQQNQQRNR